MANEFIIKNGFQSKGNSQITGSLNVSSTLTVNGSEVGAAFPFTGDAKITGSLDVSGSITTYGINMSTWTLGADGGNNYYYFTGPGDLGGTEENPDIYLVRGQKYRFYNPLNAHPFQIQDTAGSAFSTGVTNNGVQLGFLSFDVPMDGPTQLKYQCTSHAAMAGNIYIANALTDTNFTQSLFVTPSGDNVTAVVGNTSKPFQTILAATASANIGDTIIVYPGTYTADNANIIKDGVNYYFYPGAIVNPTASLSENIVNIIDPTHPVNVRGAGSFISDDTNYGAIRIQAKECYFEFDTAKTTNNTTNSNPAGTVILDPTNTDAGYLGTETQKGNSFYVKGNIINTGDFGTYGACLHYGTTGLGTDSLGTFEGSIMQLHATDTSPAVYIRSDSTNYKVNIDAYVFASASRAVYDIGRGDVRLRGQYSTADSTNYYAIEFADTYRGFYDIDADIQGAIKLDCGSVNNSGGLLRGRIRTANVTPDDAAIYINGGGQHKIDNQIFLREYNAFGIKIETDDAQVEFTGDFNPDAASSHVNFCKVTTGKLIFKGSLGSTANRGAGNIINGGHLVINSFFDNDGSNSPSNAFCFQLSGGTLEINDKVTHTFTTTGSGFVDMTGGYLILNGAELVQLSGTGSFAHCIKLTGGQTGSFFNNSFTNLNVFNDSSLFLNEMAGSGSLFFTDKLR